MGVPVFVGDRVLVTTGTAGTGTYSLDASAVSGYLTLANAGIVSGSRVAYTVVDSQTNPSVFEIGEGIYTAGSPATITRALIIRNSSGGTTAISWSAGTKFLFLAPSASRFVMYDSDGNFSLSTPFTIGSGTVSTTALSPINDRDTGLYFSGENKVALAAGGSKIFEVTTTSAAVNGPLTVASTLVVSAGGCDVTGVAVFRGNMVTTSSVTVAAGGLTVSLGGAAITGNSTVTGTFTATGLVSANNGITVSSTATFNSIVRVGSTTDTPGAGNTNTGATISNNGSGHFSVATGSYATLINRNDDGVAITFQRSGSQIGYVFVSTSVLYATSSDYRLKENFEIVEDGIFTVQSVPVYRFNWKERPNSPKILGFLAHELQEYLPQAVVGPKDGEAMQAVDLSQLVPALWGAVKSLIQRVEDLEDQVRKLTPT